MCRPESLFPIILLLVGTQPDEKPPRDQDRIQGVWNLVSGERDGNPLLDSPPDDDDPFQLEFRAETFRFRLPAGAGRPDPYKIDPNKKPKTFDILPGGKHGPAKPILGIYELDGDSLKICWGAEGKARPQEFKAPAGSGHWLLFLKRAKDQ